MSAHPRKRAGTATTAPPRHQEVSPDAAQAYPQGNGRLDGGELYGDADGQAAEAFIEWFCSYWRTRGSDLFAGRVDAEQDRDEQL